MCDKKDCVCYGIPLIENKYDEDVTMVIKKDKLTMKGEVNWEYFVSFEFTVKFCPMCGRDLKE